MVLRKLFSRFTSSDEAIVSRYLAGADLSLAKKIIASGTVSIATQSWNVSGALLKEEAAYPQLFRKKPSEKYDEEIRRLNDALKHGARQAAYAEFAKKADVILPRLFAPSVEGLEIIREALALQLFARDTLHILCLADPQVGIDTLANHSITFHPVSVICDVTKLPSADALWQGPDGKSPGVLAGAHQGIICIQRFEKLNQDQRNSVLQVIDRGFLGYNVDGHMTRTPVSARILGIVNPLVDSFVGKDAALIKQQVPFDFSLTQHFHLTFLVQRSSLLRFADPKLPALADNLKNLHENDLAFIRAFVSAAEDREAVFSKEFQPLIVEWTGKLKARKQIAYIHDIVPNTIIAVIRLSQAHARMKWRSDVTLEDLKLAMDIVQTGLEIR